MTDFDPKTLIDLDECVINALDLFADPKTKFPRPDLGRFKRPLVVGSGNAIATGRIIFDSQDAVFADEGTFKSKLNAIEDIDGVALFSASGGKHAPIIAKEVKPRKLPVLLFTCNPSASANGSVDETYVFPSRPEPYTYNTSTYMGMMMGCLLDDPQAEAKKTRAYIREVIDPTLANFGKKLGDFPAFYLLVPEHFELIRIMLATKFVELFARHVARDVFTWEQSKHATTVVETPGELFISFGRENDTFGRERLNIPLPDDCSYPAIMAIGYYVIGKIQVQKPDWFKQGIVSFAERAGKLFGQTIKPLVEFK
ncbi:MAG: hypothetical protein JW993_01095 [Sedimentisphaerales bacterium]|nr:hypothetical protein [Sedimentisphaerales bacterium]